MDFIKELIREHFNVWMLFALFVILVSALSFMVHWSRLQEMIHWVENLVDSVFGAMIGYLAGRVTTQK